MVKFLYSEITCPITFEVLPWNPIISLPKHCDVILNFLYTTVQKFGMFTKAAFIW